MRARAPAFTRVIRKQWGCIGLIALCALGCSGQAESSDAVRPPSGFYRATWQTVSDSCQPMEQDRTSEELLGASPDKVTIVMSRDHRHQEIPWDQPFMWTWSDCGATVSYNVVAKSADSLVVDSQWDWVNPQSCASVSWLEVPSSNCTLQQTVTYELLQACPTTRNNVSCTN